MSWQLEHPRWLGRRAVDKDLNSFRDVVNEISRLGESLVSASTAQLQDKAASLRQRVSNGTTLDDLLPEAFALTGEFAHRLIGMRPYDVQLIAAVGLYHGRLVEMQTGEGKTLAAVLPAALRALQGQGVHILTFNDYLARRDATWMRPVYAALGLSVGTVQPEMSAEARRAAYAADVTYATAKEAGFDFLRAGLAYEQSEIVQRAFNYAIIDEADSILIDEARVPLVIAGASETVETDPRKIAEIVKLLIEGIDWERDKNERNVQLTASGTDKVEASLDCGSLHAEKNAVLLTEINQALHARALLHRDVDYIVDDGRIGLVDDFTGRVVADRRWPDGLQAALEAKEGLVVQPSGRILGSTTLQHFIAHYPLLAGMTATARTAAEELWGSHRLRVLPIPPHRPCLREDLPDLIFSHREAKEQALLQEIARVHASGRPMLIGTNSVEESEHLAGKLAERNIPCRVLNAKNDEFEAAIIANAGAFRAVTISTNMAGRGTDIRLGGADEAERARVLALGGLYVIGTNRHESRRIDDQLRGRAGRQGDVGTSRFFVSLEDPLMIRFGIDDLIPKKLRPLPQDAPLNSFVVRREVERLQRIVEGQNQEIRATLARYSAVVEQQRATLATWRSAVLTGNAELDLFVTHRLERHAELLGRLGVETLRAIERNITLHHIDAGWTDHLALIAEVREGIHLAGIGGMDPFSEFHKQVAVAFSTLHQKIENGTIEELMGLQITAEGLPTSTVRRGPSATWTYLINDRAVTELHRMLHGPGSSGFSAAAVLMTWPFLLAWAMWRRFSARKPPKSSPPI